MNNSSYTTATTVSTLYPLPESRILIYEKDGKTLKPIKIYYDDNGRKWIEARPDTKFVIEIKNNSGNNALAVVSVDGLNVIDGKRAELKNERGYIVNRYSSSKISGWRTSLEEVREFVFTSDKEESFSHKLGADESNTGVIGIAVFKEKTPSWYYTYTSTSQPWTIPIVTYPTWTVNGTGNSGTTYALNTTLTNTCTTYSTSTFGPTYTSCSTATTDGLLNEDTDSLSMSTKQGDVVLDEVQEISMEFDEMASWTDIIYYDSYENLVKKGIIKKGNKLPEPFANNGFCPSL